MKLCPACCQPVADFAVRCNHCGETLSKPHLERSRVEASTQNINKLLAARKKSAAAQAVAELVLQITNASNADDYQQEMQNLQQARATLGTPVVGARPSPYLKILWILVGLQLSQMAIPFLRIQPPPTKELIRWEYRIESIDDRSFDTEMASLGQAGWELVFARRASGSYDQMLYEAIFKRPILKPEGPQ